MQTFQVQVPQGIGPGMQFQVNVNGQLLTVTCPPNAGPGMMITIQAPAAAAVPMPAAYPPQQVVHQQPMMYPQHQQTVVMGGPGYGGKMKVGKMGKMKQKGYKHKGYKGHKVGKKMMKGFGKMFKGPKFGFKGFKGPKFGGFKFK